MCGIFGVHRVGGLTTEDRLAFERLSTNLVHRGPDGSGLVSRPDLVMGMHRLSIMDVEHGWQPFWSAGNRVGVVANGEIYNALEVANSLRNGGTYLATHSDIEVIPHLYARYGRDYVHRLRGMFAIAIFDAQTQRLVLTRDRLGEKPLYFAEAGGAFWFSSELRPLVTSGIKPLELSPEEIRRYLVYGFVPDPRTIIEGVYAVPAGAHLTLDLQDGSRDVTEYWNPLDYLDDRQASVDEGEELLMETAELTTRSDVPVALALSSGLDSSLVAALCQRARGDLTAISVGYTNRPSMDETAEAERFAGSIGMSFHRVQLNPLDIARSFAGLCQRQDEPTADIAGSGYDALAMVARQLGFPVLVNGQGGDELFWGYEWVRRLAAIAKVQDAGKVGGFGLERPPKSPGALWRWWDDSAGLSSVQALKHSLGVDPSEVEIPLFALQPGHRKILRDIAKLFPGQAIDDSLTFPLQETHERWPLFSVGMMNTYLRSNGLAQVDRLSMAHSVEARTPLVDYKVVEWALSTMARPTVLEEAPKAYLVGVGERLLPNYVLNRQKSGFTPPVRDWLAEIWKEEDYGQQPPELSRTGLLDDKALRTVLRRAVGRTGVVSQVSFRLAVLETWFRGFADE